MLTPISTFKAKTNSLSVQNEARQDVVDKQDPPIPHQHPVTWLHKQNDMLSSDVLQTIYNSKKKI